MQRSTRRWVAALGVAVAATAVGPGPVRAAPPDPTYEVFTELDRYAVDDIVNYRGTCYPNGSGPGLAESVTIQVYDPVTGGHPGELRGGTGLAADGTFTGWIQLAAHLPDGRYQLEATCETQQLETVAVVYSGDFTIGPPAATTTTTTSANTTVVPSTVPGTGATSVPAAPPAAEPAAAPATATAGSPSYTG